jgi:fatty acid synthase subunit alpha
MLLQATWSPPTESKSPHILPVTLQKVHDDVLKLWSVVKSQLGISQEQKNRIKALYEGVVRSLRKDLDPPRSCVETRSRRSSSQF